MIVLGIDTSTSQTSVALGAKLVIVVLDNRGFACIERLQAATGGASFNNLLGSAAPRVVASSTAELMVKVVQMSPPTGWAIRCSLPERSRYPLHASTTISDPSTCRRNNPDRTSTRLK